MVCTLVFELSMSFSIMFLIFSADSVDWSASTRISSATTAKPLPFSPALAASIEALSERRLVWLAISAIRSVALRISSADWFVSIVCLCISSTDTLVLLLISTRASRFFSASRFLSFMVSALSASSDIFSLMKSIECPICSTCPLTF